MVTRRAVLGAMASLPAIKAKQRKRPNFIFMIADDHAGYVLGEDGNRKAETPNLDRFAADCVVFSKHYCNSPICTPSRQSIFTGQMPHMAGVTRLMTPLSDDKPTLAWQFRKAGYTTAVFGKMHFQRPPFALQHGFDIPETEYAIQKDWLRDVKPSPIPPGIPVQPPWRPLKDPARIWLNADKLPFPRFYEGMEDTYTANRAVQFLEDHRNSEKPFALWVSFRVPHSPFKFPIEDRDEYKPNQFVAPRVGPEDAWQIPLIFRDLTDSDKRGINAAYYTSVRFLDRIAGVVLDKLHETHLDQNTFILYTADHGYDLGQHGRFEKHCGYDPALRVPLFMRFPGITRHRIVKDLTEHVDVSATITDMMDIPRLPVQHGQSLRPYLEGKPMPTPRDHIFSEYLDNEEAYIRTDRYKFIYCSGTRVRTDGYKTADPTPGRYVRLYDHNTDPGEFYDVSEKHPDLVKKFKSIMLDTFRRTHPDAHIEPKHLTTEAALDFYLRPRDA